MEIDSQLSASLRIFGIVIPVAGVFAVSETHRNTVIAAALGLPALVTALASLVGPGLLPDPVPAIFALCFYAFTTAVLLIHVVTQRVVETDTICGALAVYLMLGLTWAVGFILVERFSPGSFSVGSGESVMRGTDALYFSYVTLTSLGYGDITPVSAHAQSLAILESLTGVLYLVVLISRLVGIYQTRQL